MTDIKDNIKNDGRDDRVETLLVQYGHECAAEYVYAAGTTPWDADGRTLLPDRPGTQGWEAIEDEVGSLTDWQEGAITDGWADIMDPAREAAAQRRDPIHQVAVTALELAAEDDEPGHLVGIAKEAADWTIAEMGEALGLPTQGAQCQTLQAWLGGTRTPGWESREKMKALADRL